MPLKFTSRKEWSALPNRCTVRLTLPVRNVIFSFITHTEPCYDIDECRLAMRTMQRIYMSVRKKPDLSFNFMVGGDGRVYEGRGWHFAPGLHKRLDMFSPTSISIGYFGDLKTDSFKADFWETGFEILAYGYKNNYLSANVKIMEEQPYD